MWEDEYDADPNRDFYTIKSRRTGVSNYMEVLMDREVFQQEFERQPWQAEIAAKINAAIEQQMHGMIVNNEGKITTKEQEEANKMRDNPLFGSF